jgi:hypothetical protein
MGNFWFSLECVANKYICNFITFNMYFFYPSVTKDLYTLLETIQMSVHLFVIIHKFTNHISIYVCFWGKFGL